MNNELRVTLDKLPLVRDKLKELFDVYVTLENILQHDEACKYYHHLMLYVIAEREKELGNVEYDFMSYRITTDFDEIKRKYGGTKLLPLI